MTDFVLMWPSSTIEQMKARGLVRESTEDERRAAPDVVGWFQGVPVCVTLPVEVADMNAIVDRVVGSFSALEAAHWPADPETIDSLGSATNRKPDDDMPPG